MKKDGLYRYFLANLRQVLVHLNLLQERICFTQTDFACRSFFISSTVYTHEMFYKIWYHLCNLTNVKNTRKKIKLKTDELKADDRL